LEDLHHKCNAAAGAVKNDSSNDHICKIKTWDA